MRLKGKLAWVTGAGSGIGEAAALALASEGAEIVLTGRTASKLERVAGLITKAGGNAHVQPADVMKSNAVQAVADFIKSGPGRVDILVNNAGANLKARTMRELTPETWDAMIRANLDGAFYCTHAVLPQMLDQKDGVIVNIVSVAGKRANPLGGAAYVAAKFGMGGMGLVLANEEKDSGIRVSNVCPGEIDTPILSQRPTAVTDAHRAAILKPEDVADAILYVCNLPPSVHVPELVIKPTTQMYW